MDAAATAGLPRLHGCGRDAHVAPADFEQWRSRSWPNLQMLHAVSTTSSDLLAIVDHAPSDSEIDSLTRAVTASARRHPALSLCRGT
jgi:hypothetical protein